MNVIGFLFVITTIVGICVANKITTKYDNINVDTVLQNDRVLGNYIKCLMDEGPCTAEGRDLKKTLPVALSSGCNKCNDKQKQNIEKVIKHLMKKKNRDWERLSKKYDPAGEFKSRYESLFSDTS